MMAPITSMSRTVLLTLLVVLVAVAKADCEYDDEWCCDPMSWCEFFHFTFYQVMFLLVLMGCWDIYYIRFKVGQLTRHIIHQGGSQEAAVLTVRTKRYRTRKSEGINGYGALVEYQTRADQSGTWRIAAPKVVRKWVKISEKQYNTLKDRVEPFAASKESEYQEYSKTIHAHELKRLKSGYRNNGTTVVIYNLPDQPKSAVVGDTSVNEFALFKQILLVVAALLSLGMMAMLYYWFLNIYDFDIPTVWWKMCLMVLVQLLVAGLFYGYVTRQRYRQEHDFIVSDEVGLVGDEEIMMTMTAEGAVMLPLAKTNKKTPLILS